MIREYAAGAASCACDSAAGRISIIDRHESKVSDSPNSCGEAKPSPSRTEEELVAACLSGDIASWDALIARYQGFIYALALRMGLAEPDADDVFQNVCVSLFQHLGDLRDTGRLSGWLAAITRQEVWQLHRRRKTTRFSEVPEGMQIENAAWSLGAERPESPEDMVLALERSHFVRVGLRSLGPPCRELLTLLYKEDPPCTYAEVAERMAMPLGSIGPRRARCLEQLKKHLEKHGF